MVKIVLRYILDGAVGFGLFFSLGWDLLTALSITFEPMTLVLASLILTVGYVSLRAWLGRSSAGHRSLKANSDAFSAYYSKWYAQEGYIHIICSDTEWLEHERMRPIVDQIRTKGQRAHLYLRDVSGPITQSLVLHGVQVFETPADAAVNLKMSVIVNDNYSEAIIRHKRVSDRGRRFERNVFKETSDEYLLAFAIDFLQSIRTRAAA